MTRALILFMLLIQPIQVQRNRPSERWVQSFHANGVSRLAALAHLGAITGTTILVQVGAMSFAQGSITLAAGNAAQAAIVDTIMSGSEQYVLRDLGNLLVVSPAHTTNRILALRLGPISFNGTSISELHPFLANRIRSATGCKEMGYGWAGAPMEAGIPPIHLYDPTFEEVLQKVADAQKPTMWILETEPTQFGCIENPSVHWQVGLYGCNTAFRESVGLNFVNYQSLPQALLDGCSALDHTDRMPNPIPTLK